MKRNKEELYQVFLEDLGQTPEDLFEKFDTNPIAAASIAQVYELSNHLSKTVSINHIILGFSSHYQKWTKSGSESAVQRPP